MAPDLARELALEPAVLSAIASAYFLPRKAEALIFPSVALVWFALAASLLILGLLAEAALRGFGRRLIQETPLTWEERRA